MRYDYKPDFYEQFSFPGDTIKERASGQIQYYPYYRYKNRKRNKSESIYVMARYKENWAHCVQRYDNIPGKENFYYKLASLMSRLSDKYTLEGIPINLKRKDIQGI